MTTGQQVPVHEPAHYSHTTREDEQNVAVEAESGNKVLIIWAVVGHGEDVKETHVQEVKKEGAASH